MLTEAERLAKAAANASRSTKIRKSKSAAERKLQRMLDDQARLLQRICDETVTDEPESERDTAASMSCVVLRDVRVTSRQQDMQRMMTLVNPLKIATCDVVHVRRAQ